MGQGRHTLRSISDLFTPTEALGKLLNICVPPSPITWYRSKGGDSDEGYCRFGNALATCRRLTYWCNHLGAEGQ